MLTRISTGIVDMGHGGWGDVSVVSVAACSTGIGREAKEAMSSDVVEWWAGFGTVAAAFDGLGLVGFDLKDEGGKYLFL